MSVQLKNISIIAASALIVTGNIYAAPPTAYDNWVVEDGVIYSGAKDDGWMGGPDIGGAVLAPESLDGAYVPNYTPPTNSPVSGNFSCDDGNITCKVLVQDDGFLYEEITYTSPNYADRTKTYLRLIVVDDTVANGDSSNVSFSSESFVPFAIAGESITQGVAVKQVVRDSQDNFVDVAEIQKAFMRLDPDVTLESTGAQGDVTIHPSPLTPAEETFTTKLLQTFNTGDIDSSFGYTNYTRFVAGSRPTTGNSDLDDILGQKTELSQTVVLGDNEIPGDPLNKARQAFEFRQASGYMGTTSSTFGNAYFIPASPLSVAGSMDLENFTQADPDNNYTGSPISWSNGNDVRVTWIAATDLVDFGDGLPNEIGFAYQQVVNASNGTEARERFLNFVDGNWSLPTDPFAAAPFDWNTTTFGDQPVF